MKKEQQYVLAKMQWFYVDELIALGYEALRARAGKDEKMQVRGPDGTPFSIRIVIQNDLEEVNTVDVSIEADNWLSDAAQTPSPLKAGFTMLESGETRGHSY